MNEAINRQLIQQKISERHAEIGQEQTVKYHDFVKWLTLLSSATLTLLAPMIVAHPMWLLKGSVLCHVISLFCGSGVLLHDLYAHIDTRRKLVSLAHDIETKRVTFPYTRGNVTFYWSEDTDQLVNRRWPWQYIDYVSYLQIGFAGLGYSILLAALLSIP